MVKTEKKELSDMRRLIITPVTTKYSRREITKTTHRDWSYEQKFDVARYSGLQNGSAKVGDLFAFIFKNISPKCAQLYEVIGKLDPKTDKEARRSWWINNNDGTENPEKKMIYNYRNVLLLRPLHLWVSYEFIAELAGFKENWTIRGTTRMKKPVNMLELLTRDEHHFIDKPENLQLYTEPEAQPEKEPEKFGKGWVYFIQEREEDDLKQDQPRSVKIGFTLSNCVKRQKQLQTGNPRELFVYRRIYTCDYQKLEYHLHQAFSTKRIRGEWFLLSQNEINDLVNFIKGNNKTKSL